MSLESIESIVNEYKIMQQLNIKCDYYTFSIIFNTCIRCQRFEYFEYFLHQTLESKHSKDIINTYVLSIILDGIIKWNKPYLIENIWNIFVNENCINEKDIDANCYGLGILAAYKTNNEYLANKFIFKLKKYCFKQLKYDYLCWHQILSAFGHLKQLDKMWYQYNQMKCYLKPDIVSLHIILLFDNRNKYKLKALNELKNILQIGMN